MPDEAETRLKLLKVARDCRARFLQSNDSRVSESPSVCGFLSGAEWQAEQDAAEIARLEGIVRFAGKKLASHTGNDHLQEVNILLKEAAESKGSE